MKNKTDFIYQKDFKKLAICQRKYFTPALQGLIENPEICFEKPLRYFKNNPGDTTTVSLIEADGHLLVVKRYNVKNFLHGIKLFFRKSRAMYSWNNSHRLLELGVPTIEPVAIVEKRFGPLRNKAYFFYRYAEGINYRDFLKQQDSFSSQFAQVIKKIAAIVKKLRAGHIYHADLHYKNVLIVENEVILLDLDHMKKYRFMKRRFHKAHQKEVNKFMKYLGDNAEARALFIKEID